MFSEDFQGFVIMFGLLWGVNAKFFFQDRLYVVGTPVQLLETISVAERCSQMKADSCE